MPRITSALSRISHIALALGVSACATMGTTAGSPSSSTTAAPAPTSPWRVATSEHVDLWLHGYAMLTADTAHVPLFQRGYRERMRQLRAQRNVYTQLDANQENLSSRFTTNPSLVNGQFVAMYFQSWDEMAQVIPAFVQAGGDPRAATDPTVQGLFAVLRASFPTAADRDWLRLFTQSLGDERARFYHDYWTNEQSARADARAAVDSLWQKVYRPKLKAFLERTQQADGTLLLSLPLDGEGRTIAMGQQSNAIAVEYPATRATATDAIDVIAHEVVNAATTTAINDNVTPAEQRSGAAARYTANASVRGGAMLLQRTAPELVAGYMRHYLHSAGASAPSGDPTATFVAAFPLPESIRDAIGRQLDVILGGI